MNHHKARSHTPISTFDSLHHFKLSCISPVFLLILSMLLAYILLLLYVRPLIEYQVVLSTFFHFVAMFLSNVASFDVLRKTFDWVSSCTKYIYPLCCCASFLYCKLISLGSSKKLCPQLSEHSEFLMEFTIDIHTKNKCKKTVTRL